MSISTTALDRRSAVKIAAAASLLAAGGACIFMVDAAHAEDEGRAEGGRETGPYAGRVGFLALVALLACSMFPVLVNATADSVGPAITLANAASSELSLTWMTIILCIGLPLVLVYHVVIYRTFRGRVNPADLEEY